MKAFTLTCMSAYSDAACQKMLEAEALVCRAMELRDEAKAMFARAHELALEYAAVKAEYDSLLRPEEPIPW